MSSADGLIGRDRECGVAAIFVAAAASGPAVLGIDGEAGIGKTSLFRYTVDLARLGGSTVLECNPTHAEATLSYVGLTDMLRYIPESAFEALPAPQRHSLEVATLRAAPSEVPIDERAVGTGLATLLAHLAEAGAVVLAVDDLQWLDHSSADVLRFAARRLSAAPIGILTCERMGESAHKIIEAVKDPIWTETINLTGLGAAALFHVVRAQLGITLPRPALVRVVESSGGNPFAALVLARGVGRGDELFGGVRISDLVHGHMAHRIDELTEPARDALLATALSPRSTVAMFEALGMATAIEEVDSKSIVDVVDGRVVFAHPLLAAAVIHMASDVQQRAMHARLASVANDPEARARHRALSNPDRNEEIAMTLDEAALVAKARGSSIAAAELARLALDRTVEHDSESAWTRRIHLAKLLHSAGSSIEAGAVLGEGACPPGPLRAQVGLILTEVAYQTSTLQSAVDHATAALADARGNATLEARCLLSLATLATGGPDNARFTAESRRVLEAAEIDDPELLAWAECQDVSARFHMGDGLDRVGLDHALALERTGRTWLSSDQVAAIRPVLLKWADQPHDALAGLDELRARAEDEGNEGVIPYVAGHVPGILLRLGRLHEAASAAADHLDLAERTGQESQRMQALYNVALVDAHLGKLITAEAAGEEILQWARQNDDQWLEMSAVAVLGFVAISGDDTALARARFDRWSQLIDELDVVDPGVSRFYGDHIESLLSCGELVEAAMRAATLELRSARAGRLSASAIAARCRALLAAAAGDTKRALEEIHLALDLDLECSVPFDRCRSLLVAGVIHRRARQKAAARDALLAAAQGFAAMGAQGWSQHCEAELQRVGTPARDAMTLTATEQKIAELAASGLTNRQVGEKSFMSPKTVEANLARVYRKLGISSRAELGARMSR